MLDEFKTEEESPESFKVTGSVINFDPSYPIEYRWSNPVEVFDEDGKLLGAASLKKVGSGIDAEVFMTYDNPIRLDIQNGDKRWALPNLTLMGMVTVREEGKEEYQVPTILKIDSVVIASKCEDPNLPPLGPSSL